MQIWEELPELYWYFEAPRKKPAALVLAEHPTAIGSEGKLPLIVYQFLGAGKVMFHAFDDTWRWRFRAGDQLFRPLLGPDDPVHGPIAPGRPASGRDPDGPATLPARPADPVPRPVPQPRPGPVRRRRHDPGPAKGQGPRKLTLKLVPGTKNVFEGALPQAAEGTTRSGSCLRHRSTGRPPPSFRVDAPINELRYGSR